MNETAGLEVSILVVDSLYGLSFIENIDKPDEELAR
jgi:hypothetical protein